MAECFDSAAPLPPASGFWRYRRPAAAGIVEWGEVRGRAVALPAHVHDEDQVTFVLAGRRRFCVGGTLVSVGPGEGVALPAGTPHASLNEPDGVVCHNAYLPVGTYALQELVSAVSRRWRRQGSIDAGLDGLLEGPAFIALLQDHCRDHLCQAHQSAASALPGPRLSVTRAADRAGMSREGYSRAFRRTHGVLPSAFRASARLNAARRLLRAGVPLAAVAADAGFADQSHLGRCFRHAFGITPGLYRAGWDGSHPFQTGPRLGV